MKRQASAPAANGPSTARPDAGARPHRNAASTPRENGASTRRPPRPEVQP